MRKLIRHILKEETSFVNHKGEYQKYDKIINKLVYLVFDEGICSFTWDAFEIPTRNGHVTQIILNFTPKSFRELGYEKYHKLRTELKDVIMNYVPLFTQVYVVYDTTKCDDQLNESENKKQSLIKLIDEYGLYDFTKMSGLNFNQVKSVLNEMGNPKELLKRYINEFVLEKGGFNGENYGSLFNLQIPLNNTKYVEDILVHNDDSIVVEIWEYHLDEYGHREQKDQYLTTINNLTNEELLAIVAWMMESIKEGTINESIVVKRRLDDLSKHITSSYKWLDPKRFDGFDEYLERVIFNVVRDFVSELGNNQDYETQLKVREEIKPFVTQYIIDNYLEDIKYYFGIFT